MSAKEPAWQTAAQASEVLAPEMGLLAELDPADFGTSLLAALARAAGRPDEAGQAWLRFASAMVRAWPVAVARWAGSDTPPPVPPDEKDKRFADPVLERQSRLLRAAAVLPGDQAARRGIAGRGAG